MKNSAYSLPRFATVLFLLMIILGPSQAVQAITVDTTTKYFPLPASARWVLKQSSTGHTVSFEVVSSDGLTSRLRATTPWGSSDWELTDRTTQYEMTGYGGTSGVAKLGTSFLMYRFDQPVGTKWTNQLGTFSISARGTTVTVGSKTYVNCLRIQHDSNGTSYVTTFAPGAGLVQYSVAGQTFGLDEVSSRLPTFPSTSINPLPPLGVLPNCADNERDDAASANRRLDTLTAGGVSFLLGYGNWRQMEPSAGKFDMGALRYHVSIVSTKKWTSAYTLTLINMDKRELPVGLENLAWNDSRMQSRVLKLIDAMTAEFKGEIDYFQFGNEVDTYFETHPSEVGAYLTLFKAVKTRMKARSPSTKVSITFKQSTLSKLSTTYSKLDAASDLLVITYGPYSSSLDAMPPSIVVVDVAAIKLAARGRKILFQEVAYPSSTLNLSSLEQQAQFFFEFLNELRGVASQVAGAQIFLLSELSADTSDGLASSLGMASSSKFSTMLQSFGLFDTYSMPKPAWTLLTQELTH